MSSESGPVAAKASGRKGNKKVRTGCVTCKVRKVKCDEAKPSCLRCIKTGRKCEGYIGRAPSPSSTSLLRLRPTMDFESPEGCRAFDYYRSQSAPALSSIMDSEFWGGLVMRLTVTEPIVRHAVLAMSSLHEHLSNNRDQSDSVGPSFIYSEYGKSISALRNWKACDGPTIPLLACILYTCMEFLLDNEPGARMHILEGRKLLGTLSNDCSPAVEMVKRDLVPMYTRLGVPAFLFGGYPPSVPDHLRPSMKIPTTFENMTEARAMLYPLLEESLRFGHSVRPTLYTGELDAESLQALISAQQELLSRLSHWHSIFVLFTASTKMTQANSWTLNLLLIYFNAATIWVSTSLHKEETAYDAHTTTFATIISLASAIVSGAQKGSPLSSFSFETELIAPMYWAAQKCRHPLVRRAAVRLLLKDELKNRRENLWHSGEATAIALRTIQIEEENIDRAIVSDDAGAMDLNTDLHSTTQSEASSKDSNRSDWCVSLSQPPTLSVEDFEDDRQLEELLDFNTMPEVGGSSTGCDAGSLAQVLDMRVDAGQLQPPFGVDESARIKNILIGPREKTGVSVTIFRDPQTEEDQWDIRKEMIPFL